MNAVDTNILVYAVDDNEPVKQGKAQTLIGQLVAGSKPTVLLWQVIVETVNQLRRWQTLGELSAAEFEQHVKTFRNLFPLSAPSLAALDHALDFGNRYSLSFWDSMILGACKEASVDTLYTEDMGSPRAIDNIQLINPLI
jgi:predicted nucleic acid-binding protein